ncbi:MAG TPA: site-specific integrase [Bauldia sp.]
MDRETIETSPVQTFKKLNMPRAGKETKRRQALTADEVTRLVDAYHDPELRLWVVTMVASGLRPGEASALTWASINFARGVIHVTHSVKETNVRGQGKLGPTKTASSVRDVPLGPTLAASLERAYLDRQATYQSLGLVVEPDDCIWPADLIDARKAPKSLAAMQWRFRGVRDSAGLPQASPHYLRHTALTAAIAGTATEPGISPADAARIAGHKNAMQIVRTYGHAVNANLVRGIGLADAMIGPAPVAPDNVRRLPVRK